MNFNMFAKIYLTLKWYSKNEREYFHRNKKYWNNSNFKNNEITLIDGLQEHPALMVQVALIGKAIELANRSQIICLLYSNIPIINKYKYLYKSYFIKKFVGRFPKWLHPIIWIKSILLFQKHKKIINYEKEYLINFNFENILIGDLLIDSLYRQQIMCCDRITNKKKAINLLRNFFYDTVYLKNIFKKYNVKYVVLTHKVYLFYGFLARYAHQNKCEVYIFNQNKVRRFLANDNIYEYEGKPINKNIDYVINNVKNYKILIDQFIKKKFSGDIDHIDVILNKKNRTYSLNELYAKVGFSKELPIVIIFLHVFADANHISGKNLFISHYDWIINTINIIKNNKSINWLIKTHPSEVYYNEEGLAAKIISNLICDESNIKLAPKDFKNDSVIKFAKAIITVHGTAGLEFSCYGIPVILAGNSHYSGFGFTYDPKTISEYQELLINIQDIEKLSQEQVEKAKAVYFTIEFLQNSENRVYPDYFAIGSEDRIKREIEKEKFLKNMTYKLEMYDPTKEKFFLGVVNLAKDSTNRYLLNQDFYKNENITNI